ncbi:MAG: M16 family metallopeptidase [Bacilli bacterium]
MIKKESFKYINDIKFRENVVLLNASLPLKKEYLAKLTMFERIAFYGTTSFPTKEKIIAQQENLYGLRMAIYHTIEQDLININIQFLTVEDSYVNDSTLFESVCSFVKDFVFDDNKKRFKEKFLEHEKVSYINSIKNRINEPPYICRKNMFEAIDKNLSINVEKYGSIKEIKNVTIKDIYDIQDIIKSLSFTCYLVGIVDKQKVINVLGRYFNITNSFNVINYKQISTDKEISIIKEKDVEQTQILMLYKFDKNLFKNEKISLIFSNMLGESGTSKLFKEIREKRGLCYTISSNISFKYGLLYIMLGVNDDKINEAITSIKDLINSISFTQEELKVAKQMFFTSLDTVYEDPSRLLRILVSYTLTGRLFDEKVISNEIKRVSMKNINDLAKNLKYIGYSVVKGTKKHE